MSKRQQIPIRGGLLWLVWTLASSAGWILIEVLLRADHIARVLWFQLAQQLGGTTGTCFVAPQASTLAMALVALGLGIGIGAVSGVLQWLVLRRWLASLALWVPATIAGIAIALAIEAIGVVPGYSVASLMAVSALDGALIGILQWLLLQRRVRRAGWWIVANVVGFAIG